MQTTAHVRLATSQDLSALADMQHALWPDGTREEHEAEARAIVEGKPPSTLPLVLFVAELEQTVVGFIEVGLRSHADGCDGTRPVGFIEGWYVIPEHRGLGIGASLMEAAEEWSRTHGCHEMASDTWADNKPSEDAHIALGFKIVDTCVHFRKSLE